MSDIRLAVTGLLIMFAFCTSTPSAAQSIESLVMPGDVIEGHAYLEEDCSVCHIPFSRSEQRALCLDCHELVAIDIELNLGYHGRAPNARSDECSACHTEHEGRGADIVDLDEETFDHDLSDFELLGGHVEVACVDCHLPNLTYREASIECDSCHIEDMPHDEKPTVLCIDCHNESEWVDVHFDHDEGTNYPLEGKHAEVACRDCHEVEVFAGEDDSCVACHAEDDSHNGRSGDLCETCHNPTSWNDSSFDHTRDTEFQLLGRHNELACNDCHSEDPFADTMDMACVSCHLEDDDHNGHNGVECDSCHSNDSWTDQLFDHARDTEYALNGAHAEVACESCHIEPIFEVALEENCVSCHLEDDAHEGSQGTDCVDCHNEVSWEDVSSFDHDLTQFPLLGEHDNIACDDCHETKVFIDTNSECVDCHVEDDPHEEIFADNCDVCHNPVAWDLWFFDHNTQTEFELQGAHVEVTCEGCHRSSLATMQRIGFQCLDCHRSDDVHDGEFGADCGRCHSDTSFEEVRSLQ
ncbi:MAG: cytochrome C [Woeseia sp.]|jgi:hypothetical protein|nr:cytochrome C [Woeseia sp.]